MTLPLPLPYDLAICQLSSKPACVAAGQVQAVTACRKHRIILMPLGLSYLLLTNVPRQSSAAASSGALIDLSVEEELTTLEHFRPSMYVCRNLSHCTKEIRASVLVNRTRLRRHRLATQVQYLGLADAFKTQRSIRRLLGGGHRN